jgi:amino-acid N-acetyltransferase
VRKATNPRAARPRDLGLLRALLESAELPAADLTTAHLSTFRVVEDGDGRIVGGVGLELAGRAALLRSLVVAPELRGTGLGHALVDSALELARERGVAELWLLTTTADRFFERRGWRRVERASAPAGIRATAEFASICPASCVCMVRDLQGSRREVPA